MSKKKNENNLLFKICRSGNTKKLKDLINENNINSTDSDYNTPLLLAASSDKDNCENIQYLIEKKADVRFVNKQGMNCLMMACNQSNFHILEYLLSSSNSPHINDISNGGYTALHWASLNARGNRFKILNLLLTHDADPNLVTYLGDTPLHLLVWSDRPTSIPEIDLLLTHGADIHTLNKEHRTPLMSLCCNHKYALETLPTDSKPAALLQLFLQRGAKIVNDKQGCTPLSMAALTADVGAMEVLTMYGADLTEQSFAGNSVLHICSVENDIEKVNFVLDKVNDDHFIHTVNEDGMDALTSICDSGCLHDNAEIVQLLVLAKADVNRRIEHTSYSMETQDEIIEIEKDYDNPICLDTPLTLALKAGKVNIVDTLLNNGADMNVVDINGYDIWTILNGFIDTAKENENDVVDKKEYGTEIGTKLMNILKKHEDLRNTTKT